jgi:putative phosphoesterase
MPKRWDKLPDAVPEIFKDVDLILHAGDVGELWVLDELGQIAPTIAVHGNDETDEAQRSLPYQQLLTIDGVRILLCHSHIPDRAQELASRQDDSWASKLKRRSAQAQAVGAAIYVFGHLHVPLVKEEDGVLLLNPGAIASGNSLLRQTVQSVAVLSLSAAGDTRVEHIALSNGDRGSVPDVDWGAGFRAAFAKVGGYLVSPDDQAIVKAAYNVAGDDWPVLDEAILRCAWKRWRGQQNLISLAEIIGELRADQGMPAGLFEQLTRCLTVERMD